MFKEPASYLLNDIRAIAEMEKVKEEYQSMKLQLQRFPKVIQLERPLKKMCELVLTLNEFQIELETALEPVFQMCLLVKNKGKKIIKDDFKEDIRDMLTYVNLLLKPDFFTLLLEIYNKDDLVYAIMHLQSQKSLISELKKQEPYKSGLATINMVKEEDMIQLLYNWQETYSQIEKLQKSQDFSSSYQQFKTSFNVPLDDLKKLSTNLQEYHKVVLHYHSTTSRFKIFRYKLFQYCIEEFSERVDLLWPDSC